MRGANAMQRGQRLVRWIGACALVASFLAVMPAIAVHAAGNTIVVTSNADTGAGGTCPGAACELRDAAALAGNGDTIAFQPGIGLIVLFDPVELTTNVTIDGSGATVVITGDFDTQLFIIDDPATVTFRRLALQNVLLDCTC